MKNSTALYIGADPLTFNDQSLIRRSIGAFGFIYILLDRRNRDAEYEKYSLNYTDRSDIIKHDMKDCAESFQIIPVDVTVQKAVQDNDIRNVILNLDYQKETSFKTQRALQKIMKDVNVICIQGDNFLGRDFINTLVRSDSSMKIYKDFCSDYAYAKYKVKTMKKIGITGNMGCKMEVVQNVFKDRGVNVIDLDQYTFSLYQNEEFINFLEDKYRSAGLTGLNKFIHKTNGIKHTDKCDILRYNLKNPTAQKIFEKILYQRIQEQIMKSMINQFNDVIVIKFVLIYEYAMEGLFDRVISVGCDSKMQYKNLSEEGYTIEEIQCINELEQPIEEKMDYADMKIYTDKSDEEIVSDTVMLINTRLKGYVD